MKPLLVTFNSDGDYFVPTIAYYLQQRKNIPQNVYFLSLKFIKTQIEYFLNFHILDEFLRPVLILDLHDSGYRYHSESFFDLTLPYHLKHLEEEIFSKNLANHLTFISKENLIYPKSYSSLEIFLSGDDNFECIPRTEQLIQFLNDKLNGSYSK